MRGMMSIERAKKAAAVAALDWISEGMCVGLGSGTTAECFIHELGKKCQAGFDVRAVASSERSRVCALEEKIPLLSSEEVVFLDVVVDGADEIDMQGGMIKGGGGALLCEKLLASVAKEVLIIVDETKCVSRLGTFPLPVEVVPFLIPAIQKKIESLGCRGRLRQVDGVPFETDLGHWIFDLFSYSEDVRTLQDSLKSIVGVVETGLFLNVATQGLIGREDGSVIARTFVCQS